LKGKRVSFEKGNGKNYDKRETSTPYQPHPPTPSPTERGSAGNNLLKND